MNTSIQTFELNDIAFDINFKSIKNVHLSVHPPLWRVTISAPIWMDFDTIRLFAIAKLGWIRKQQDKLKNQKRETEREYIDREGHHFLWKRYLLKVIEDPLFTGIKLKHSEIHIHLKDKNNREKKEEILHSWYRQQLRISITPMLEKYSESMNITINDIKIRKMRTKWWSCNSKTWRILLNTELAKKSLECIEYVLIHEMVHMLERNHNDTFKNHMTKYCPKWENIRVSLNRSELWYLDWNY